MHNEQLLDQVTFPPRGVRLRNAVWQAYATLCGKPTQRCVASLRNAVWQASATLCGKPTQRCVASLRNAVWQAYATLCGKPSCVRLSI